MKKIYFIALTLLLGIAQDAWAATTGNWQNNCDASWGSDYSTSSSFTISTAAQLAKFASIVNAGNNFSGKTITLAEDIDLSEHYWLPIGTSESYSFNGSFDGAGHTISGMYINETRLYNGLFGYINSGAGIRNLKLTDSQINAQSSFTGAIVGYAKSGKIQNCSVASSVEVTSSAAQSGDGEQLIATGGLVGRIMNSADMTGCVSGAAVSGTEKVGGLAGEEVSANIVGCLYTGSSVNGGTSTTQAALFGNINGGDVLSALGANTFVCVPKCIKAEYVQKLDKYFTRYGYRQNAVQYPNMSHRQNYNYIQIAREDNIGYANLHNGISIPANAMETINDIYRSGVTIWNNHTNFGDYSVSNNIT